MSRQPRSPARPNSFLTIERFGALLVSLASVGCGGDEGPDDASGSSPLFTEITAKAGFEAGSPHRGPGTYWIPEISPGGVALLDFDGDGDLDIYRLIQPPSDSSLPDAPKPLSTAAPNRLWAQNESGRFVEVPGAAGLDDPGYSNAVALGDVDNDGDVDIYIANLLEDRLYLNDGAGRFVDGTAGSGIDGAEWSSGAAFLDYDADGDLDLFVCHYLVDDPERLCRVRADAPRDYCGPAMFQGVPDTLYRNDGDGRFTDVTRAAGIGGSHPGFGALCVDLTGDGRVDIYVANDKKANHLWVNRGDGTFRDEALERGVALSGAGKTEASMGIAVGDTNGDGAFDILLTHLVDETHTLYRGDLGGRFNDKSATSGIGGPTRRFTGWGCGLVDFDHDGDVDLAIAHGRVARGEVLPGASSGPFWDDYAEPNVLFLNDGSGRFADASARAGEFSSRAETSRGLAFGDLDRDGDIDMVETRLGPGIRIFRNDAPRAGSHWLRVRAIVGKRDAIGAIVTLVAGGKRRPCALISSHSFACANELVAHFGLGPVSTLDSVTVRWVDGSRERFAVSGVDRVVTLRRGEGSPDE